MLHGLLVTSIPGKSTTTTVSIVICNSTALIVECNSTAKSAGVANALKAVAIRRSSSPHTAWCQQQEKIYPPSALVARCPHCRALAIPLCTQQLLGFAHVPGAAQRVSVSRSCLATHIVMSRQSQAGTAHRCPRTLRFPAARSRGPPTKAAGKKSPAPPAARSCCCRRHLHLRPHAAAAVMK
jgi:Zn finger protein HypA/HybF involved in hydrogenase expression